MQPKAHHWALAVTLSVLLHVSFAGAFLPSGPGGGPAGGAPGARTIGLALHGADLDSAPVAPETTHEMPSQADDPPATATATAAVEPEIPPDEPDLDPPTLVPERPEPEPQAPEPTPSALADGVAAATTSAAPPFLPHPSPARPERRPPPQPVEPARPTSQPESPAPPTTTEAPADSSAPAEHAGAATSAAAATAAGPAAAAAAALAGRDPASLREAYLATLRTWLERHKVYPQNARKRRQTGSGTLQFTVERNGRVAEYRLAESTGDTLLDRAVVAMIERAQPLPPIPEALQVERLAVVVTVAFTLE